MYLMRIGVPGAEKPVVRLDDDRYMDVSDVVTDFNEAFFARRNGRPADDWWTIGSRRARCNDLPVSGSARRSPGRTRFCASV